VHLQNILIFMPQKMQIFSDFLVVFDGIFEAIFDIIFLSF